jgi:hypothetical protein
MMQHTHDQIPENSMESDQFVRSDWITDQSDLAPLTTFQIFKEQQQRYG